MLNKEKIKKIWNIITTVIVVVFITHLYIDSIITIFNNRNNPITFMSLIPLVYFLIFTPIYIYFIRKAFKWVIKNRERIFNYPLIIAKFNKFLRNLLTRGKSKIFPARVPIGRT